MLTLLQTAERTSQNLSTSNYVYQRHAFAYMNALEHLGENVIELGCGSGYGMQMLAPSCNWYVGLDKYIPGHWKAAVNTAFFKANFPRLDNIGDNSFDTVICFQVIEHIKEDELFLKEAHRILKPGGRLLLTTPNRLMSLTRNPFHVREYTPAAMKQVISPVFSDFELTGIYGNSTVMQYYGDNKKSVEKITRWDILNLQNNLPAALLKIPYSIMNNVNRHQVFSKNPDRSNSISSDDFYTRGQLDNCLDFFVVAKK